MGAELFGELGHAPASDSGRLEPYHVERRRAKAARCRGEGVAKMEQAPMVRRGRNGYTGDGARRSERAATAAF